MLDEICARQKCEYYVEWDFEDESNQCTYACTSCTLQGQSSHIEKIADNCPYEDIIWCEADLSGEAERILDKGW